MFWEAHKLWVNDGSSPCLGLVSKTFLENIMTWAPVIESNIVVYVYSMFKKYHFKFNFLFL